MHALLPLVQVPQVALTGAQALWARPWARSACTVAGSLTLRRVLAQLRATVPERLDHRVLGCLHRDAAKDAGHFGWKRRAESF